jgi:hypothetical protein
MRSNEAFAYSRSTGYFCSVAALPTTANKESPDSEAGAKGWDFVYHGGHRDDWTGNGRPLSTMARF